ncbi:MAG TPA: hypothetical protein VEG30_17115 [Terriglobales bacterium]|nr:hypothetical protein [Terriglobales bacterium]
MSQTITIRLTKDLAAWLERVSRTTGLPVGRIIREHLEKARSAGEKARLVQFAGKLKGRPPDLSQRKGFSSR